MKEKTFTRWISIWILEVLSSIGHTEQHHTHAAKFGCESTSLWVSLCAPRSQRKKSFLALLRSVYEPQRPEVEASKPFFACLERDVWPRRQAVPSRQLGFFTCATWAKHKATMSYDVSLFAQVLQVPVQISQIILLNIENKRQKRCRGPKHSHGRQPLLWPQSWRRPRRHSAGRI